MNYSPMLCKKSEPFSSSKYLFEPKLDGVRCIAYFLGGVATLQSRTGKDLTTQFPEIADSLLDLPWDGVFDGEIVVLNDLGIPEFNRIQHRLGRVNEDEIADHMDQYPAVYCAFDILHHESYDDLIQVPLIERKGFLQDSGISTWASPETLQVVPYTLYDGVELFNKLTSVGWEGVVAKPLDSIYTPGKRNLWKKSKKAREGVFIICGVTRGTGKREGGVGALLLGEPCDTGLTFVGEAGTGLSQEEVYSIPKMLTRQIDCPLDKVPRVDNFGYWVTPNMVAEVEYMERSPNGRLRFPSIKRVGG